MSFEVVQNLIHNGKATLDSIKRGLFSDSSCFIIGLFSEDDLLNYYTVHYLPVYRQKHRVSEIIFLVPEKGEKTDITDIIIKNSSFPYRIRYCDELEIRSLCCFCLNHKLPAEVGRIILNGSLFPSEEKIKRIIGFNGLSQREIAVYSVLRLEKIPTDEELEIARIHSIPLGKRIDWDKCAGEIPEYDPEDVFPHNIESETIKLLETGRINKSHRVAVFSVTKSSAAVIRELKGYKVEVVLDNNSDLCGDIHEGIKVGIPEEALSFGQKSEWRIIVPTRSYKQICEQLNRLGFVFGEQVFVVYREPKKEAVDYIGEYLEDIKKGSEIYADIRHAFPDDHIYLAPYPGTGDMYLIGMYLEDRLRFDGIEKCLLVVPSKGSKSVFNLFPHDDKVVGIVALQGEKEADCLLLYTKICGFDKCKVSELNDGYDEIVDLIYIRGINGLDFNSMFQKTVFFAPIRRKNPNLIVENADTLFKQYGLEKDRTVILAPYANTTRLIEEKYWMKVADRLRQKGYLVCTNVAGSEKSIGDTVGINIPYRLLMDFLEKAGAIIALRSGLCDIISGSNAKKLILYPPGRSFINSTYYEYFSLEKMGVSDDNLWEWVAEEEKMNSIIEEIVEVFPSL